MAASTSLSTCPIARFPVERLLNADPDVQTVVCAREDEGIAIAVGAWLGGRTAVALMEGSGIGYSGLILARAQLQRTPIPCGLRCGARPRNPDRGSSSRGSTPSRRALARTAGQRSTSWRAPTT
jgi:hypothetical protein